MGAYYSIYDLGKVSDAQGNVFLQITVESADAEQVLFAKEHPKEAANGQRSFSLDAYRDTGRNSNGQLTQTHYTFKFFVGQPSYETVRGEFIKIANGKATPLSSRSNIPVPLVAAAQAFDLDNRTNEMGGPSLRFLQGRVRCCPESKVWVDPAPSFGSSG